MPAVDLSLITIGGPCKITDGSSVIYTEDAVTLEPELATRPIPSSIGGEDDEVITDLVWKVKFKPKSVWSSGFRAALLPTALFNWTYSGQRLVGNADRNVTILGADGEQFLLHRAKVTKMPDLFLGLGESLYGECEYTAFIQNGATPADVDAFYTQTTGEIWSQADYPTGHQETLCSAALGSVTGWTSVFAEQGFKLSHDLKLEPIKQGNITVDMKVKGYRATVSFKPQGPSTAQILTQLGAQGASAGIGTRLSARAQNLVITGTGISVTAHGVALQKAPFLFDATENRHGEITLITSLTAPGDRLTLA
jgi:hypothetical protein